MPPPPVQAETPVIEPATPVAAVEQTPKVEVAEAPAAPAVAATDPTTAAPGAPTPPATPATPATDAPPTATDAATGMPSDANGDVALAEGSTGTIRYGHGGPNGERNRVRVRAAKEPTPEEIAREAARKQEEEAARLAIEQQQAAAAVAAAAPAAASGEDPAVAKAKRSFACRVFKKCDPPKRKLRNQQKTEPATTQPETTDTP